MLRLLHTSDWHLGRTLFGRRRFDEYAAWLDWLLDTISGRRIDVLVVSGDIFDSAAPGARSQELYYDFLSRLGATGCRHAVIVGGNHDSPAFLDAPGRLLRHLCIHVVGSRPENPRDMLVELGAPGGEPEMLVAAIPYLRERDLRRAAEGGDAAALTTAELSGMKQLYAELGRLAESRRRALAMPELPVVFTGHLFAAGGRTLPEDGVRELYLGTLPQAGVDLFPEVADYVALGHLHLPQLVAGCEWVRYSGSPLAAGFNDAGVKRSVVEVTWDRGARRIAAIPVPAWRRMISLRASETALEEALIQLVAAGEPVWVEVEVPAETASMTGVLAMIDRCTAGTRVEVLGCRRTLPAGEMTEGGELIGCGAQLDELTPEQVFECCLEHYRVPGEVRDSLRGTYCEVLRNVLEMDEAAGGEELERRMP